jgi:TPR repeat protein
MGLHDEALPTSRYVPARHPDDAVPRFFCGQPAATMGAADEAAATLREVTAADTLGRLAALYCHGLAGQASDVQRLVRDDAVRGLALVDDYFGWLLAQALTAVGAHDEAMWWLRRGAERGFVNARFVREVDRMLAPLRGHPDMPDLLAYMDGRAETVARAMDADQGVGPLRSLTP